MASFVVSLSVAGRSCLVVGGDGEALRRAQRLRACGAEVTVVWPDVVADFEAWMRDEGVRWERRAPDDRDLEGRPFVVVSTPRDEALSRWLYARARDAGVLVCCVDQPESSSYSHVALGDVGALTVGVASGGAAPGLARRLRDAIVAGLGDEFAAFTRGIAALREATPPSMRREVLDAALEGLKVEVTVTLPDR